MESMNPRSLTLQQPTPASAKKKKKKEYVVNVQSAVIQL